MIYFVYASEIFKKSAVLEMRQLDQSFKILKDYHEVLIIDSEIDGLQDAIGRINPIFVYNCLPVQNASVLEKEDYLEFLYSSVKKLQLNKRPKMMLQVFNVNSKREYSAKDIEVYVGERLDKEGYNINILAPERIAYLIILDGICYSGAIDVKTAFRTHIDPKRFYKNRFQKRISRAELKLEEALDEFGIEVKGKTALDVGAAPGGWSLVLARNGAKIIAIDSGELNVDELSRQNLKAARADRISGEIFGDNQIVHIKSVFENVVSDPKAMLNIDLILVDINAVPEIAVKAVNRFLPLLSGDAELIMTVKCVTRNVPKYIGLAKDGLAHDFLIKSIRHLPANRMEVTLHAVRKNII